MCGVVGLINFKVEEVDISPLKKMTDSIAYRGPDDFGYYKSKNVAFGFRRLSIIDLDHGHQPMESFKRDLVVIFNGEIYNFKELKKDLEDKGAQFHTDSDTEVILHAYRHWGYSCIEKFNGMFAFALYDKRKNRVFIARDRLGIKPLYYAFIGETLIFGSEMKVILSHPHFKKSANHKAISSYLTFRYPQGDQPVFEGMKRLLPGHFMEISKTGHFINKYWEIPFFEKKEDKGEAYYLRKIEELFSQAVKRRMVSDVPLGVLLSGGLDSSIIVALMKKFTSDQINSYSIAFDQEGYDESPFAELVAKHCGTNHMSLTLGQNDYMSGLHNMIVQKSAPLSIPHEVALNQICVELKKYTTVVISGEGSDELFGGYGRVQRSPMDYKKIRFVKRNFPRFLHAPLLKIMGAKNKSHQWAGINSQMDHFFSVYNWIPFEEKWDLFTKDMLESISHDRDNIASWQKDFDYVAGGNIYDKILYMFEKNHLICLLDRLDTMSMAASVEARVPFVDHELVEFVSSIPVKYKMKWKSPFHKCQSLFKNSFDSSEILDDSKYILRKMSTKYLPHEIAFRKKKGFPVPLDNWIKQGMITHVKDILLDDRTKQRGILKREKLEELINNKQNLSYDFWGKKIWMLMNLEIWYREFID